jgi:hypothetical protein
MVEEETRFDLLLTWLSERGSGSWQQLREAYDWLFQAERREPWQTAGFCARILSTLGHIEIDWHAGRWAAAPPVLTLLPSAGAHALLTGARTRRLGALLAIEAQEDRPGVMPLPLVPQDIAPSACIVAVEDERAATALADRLGVLYSHSVSEELSRILPGLDSYMLKREAHPPRRGYGIERFEPESLIWQDVERDDLPGLYRYDTPIRAEHRLRAADGGVYAPERAVGIWSALSHWGKNRIKFDPKSVNGELIVPLQAPLPTLHARTAALCTGFAPQKRGSVLVYPNVPREVAKRIARSLDQTLTDVRSTP